MFKLTTASTTLLILHSVLYAPSVAANWFLQKDVFTSAHQNLLEGKTSQSFDSMVQAWQQNPTSLQANNLNGLLELAITEDCGHSLVQSPLPTWLSNLVIQREMVQSQNQILPKLVIKGASESRVTSIDFVRWPEETILSATPKRFRDGAFSIETKRLERASNEGLYQLTISADGEKSFTTWVLLTAPSTKQRIGWIDSRNWRIERSGLPNRACPSPVLSMSVYDLNDTSWTPLWTEDVDGKLPTTIPKVDLPDGRYWLSVGLVESRWQGEISILDIQTITRPVDYPDY
ncbi:DUF2861 family protein [Photobacterium makurazakiensis]|uniref:DUF2861 family protein n=1 Tax=Photobacterium makurazakiensis TaxID=2910234 RepID=UPI003D117C7A